MNVFKHMKLISAAFPLFIALILSGCGGGGGSPSPASGTTAPLSNLSGGQTGVIQFNSITPSVTYGNVTTAPAPQITIFGTLTFPATVSGKMPAMILAHHCGGVTASVTNLAAMLRTIGVATFVPDSFTARGFPNGVCLGGSTMTHTVAIPDMLFALKLLATHPNIDPNRIGIIGQSYGGYSVYPTAHEEVRKSIITDQLKFAAHIGLYPSGCENRIWSPNMTGAPMLMLLGGADDWGPPGECLTYSVLISSLGTPITTIVYPDAPHAWDSPGAVIFNAGWTSSKNCRFQFRLDTLQASRYDTGEQLLDGTAIRSYFNSCLTKGASAGRHDPTTAAATKDITIFLAKHFNLTVAPPAN